MNIRFASIDETTGALSTDDLTIQGGQNLTEKAYGLAKALSDKDSEECGERINYAVLSVHGTGNGGFSIILYTSGSKNDQRNTIAGIAYPQ